MSLILSTAPSSPGRGLRGCDDPVQNGWEADFGRQMPRRVLKTGCLRASRESFRLPALGRRAAGPVQNDRGQNLFWTRVICDQTQTVSIVSGRKSALVCVGGPY